jgi:hypothetical protein
MKFYYRFTRDERALVDDLLAVILSVFIVLVLYIALGPIYNQLYPRAVEVAPAGSLDLVNTFWGKFAVAVVLWAVIFLFISALRRTGYTYR